MVREQEAVVHVGPQTNSTGADQSLALFGIPPVPATPNLNDLRKKRRAV